MVTVRSSRRQRRQPKLWNLALVVFSVGLFAWFYKLLDAFLDRRDEICVCSILHQSALCIPLRLSLSFPAQPLALCIVMEVMMQQMQLLCRQGRMAAIRFFVIIIHSRWWWDLIYQGVIFYHFHRKSSPFRVGSPSQEIQLDPLSTVHIWYTSWEAVVAVDSDFSDTPCSLVYP